MRQPLNSCRYNNSQASEFTSAIIFVRVYGQMDKGNWTDLCKFWWWVFPPAEVGKGPHCVSGGGETIGFGK